jgi:hypothetical protein
VLLAAAIVAVNRRGLRHTALQFGPVLAVYGLWYVTSALGHVVSYGPTSVPQLIYGVPAYIGHEFVDGLGSVFPYAGLGAVLVFCLITWVGLSAARWSGPAAMAFALAVAAVAQATLTGLTRVQIGLTTAASSRYVYVLVALLIPIIGLALTWVAHNRAILTALVVALVVALATHNTLLLSEQAARYTEIEQDSKARISAALSLVFQDHDRVGAALIPSPDFARDLDMANLETMYRRGWIHIGTFDEPARLSVLARLRVTVHPGIASVSGRDCGGGAPQQRATVSATMHKILVHSSNATIVILYLSHAGSTGDARTIAIPAGWTEFRTTAGATLNLRLGTPATICTS